MLSPFKTVSLLGIAAVVYAQGEGGLPQCAEKCVGNSLSSTGCQQTDVKCICNSSGYISGLACCISGQCSPDDIQSTIKFATGICDSVGVTDLPASASCSSSAPSMSSTDMAGGAMGSSAMSMGSMTMSGATESGASTMATATTGAVGSGETASMAAGSAGSSVASSAAASAGASATGAAPRDYIGMAAAGVAGVAGIGAALL